MGRLVSNLDAGGGKVVLVMRRIKVVIGRQWWTPAKPPQVLDRVSAL